MSIILLTLLYEISFFKKSVLVVLSTGYRVCIKGNLKANMSYPIHQDRMCVVNTQWKLHEKDKGCVGWDNLGIF